MPRQVKKTSIKLNLGCGDNKMDGYVNIDVEPNCKPDLLWDFVTKPLPYEDDIVDEVVLFHCIEHIRKFLHPRILTHIRRVLKPEGLLLVSYPEFERCVENWKSNYRGQKDFWEKTIFGRQLFPSDHHVCIMHTPDFTKLLRSQGFTKILVRPEVEEPHNTIVKSIKNSLFTTYEKLIEQDMTSTKFKRIRVDRS